MEEEIRQPEAAAENTGSTPETTGAAPEAPKRRSRARATTAKPATTGDAKPADAEAKAAAGGAKPAAPRKPRAKAAPRKPAAAAAKEATAESELAVGDATPAGDPVAHHELTVEPAPPASLPEALVETALTQQTAEVLLSLGHQEVESAGEPVPMPRRDRDRGRRRGGSRPQEPVLVPEALGEAAPILDAPQDPAGPVGLPPITPELLAEVRATMDQQPRNDRGRGRGRDRDRNQDRGPRQPVEVAPEPELELDLILVPEAVLETVPPEWATEDPAEETLRGIFPEDGGRRGRRRRRGDRGRGPDQPAAEPQSAAPVLAQTGPIILGRSDDDRERRDRDRERGRDRDRGPDRDREREVEPRGEQRDHKEILINLGDRETRIAVMENGKLVELHVEREERVVGNVCKGRVANVLPGMDAAFVDIGLDRNAFLYVGDILFDDPSTREGSSPNRKTSRDVKIKDLAKPGQEILVQIVKGPRGTKGARVSTKMSIPGRYLVLMPDGDHLGVSRKVEDPRERDRLKKIADQIQPKGFGLIVRTEAEGRTDQELRQDLEYLLRTWEKISDKSKRSGAPTLLHKDLGIILKTIRDLFGQDVDKLVLDDAEEYEKVVDTLQQLAPDLLDRVQFYDEPTPLFTRYNLEEEIERLLRRKVWLRNGAYLLLDTTEALTTIDVNTGKFVGTSSLAETILKTNLDAVEEIARQLRLRDIGGMIVLDFIDMSSSRDRALVMRKLEDAFRKDRTRTKIAHISPLGLVEMTRKRTADNVTDLMTQVCPYCQGRGRTWSPETIAIQIEREIMKLCSAQEVDAVLIHANPEVAAWLVGAEGDSVERLERIIRRPVYVRANHDFHVEKFEVLAADMMEMEREMHPFHGGQIVECRVEKLELITPPRSAAWADGFFVDLANGAKLEGQRVRVRLTDVRRSFALGEPLAPSTSVDKSEPI